MKRINLKMKLVMIGLIIFSLGLLFISDGYAIVDEYSPQEQEGRILEEQDIRISPEAGVPTMPEKESKVPEYALGELIVKLKEGKTLEDIQELNAKYNVTAIEKVFKDIPPAQVTLDELKGKLAKLGIEHQSWYWQLDKDSPEYKDYTAKIEKEKQALQKQIQAQEELVNHLEQRQKRAPEGATSPNLENIYLLEIDKETDIPLMASEYQANSAVEYAQPNYIVKVQMLPNDPYYSSSNSWGQGYADLWGLKKINAAQAWDLSQGAGVIVAVVDTGIDYNHEDIAKNIWINTKEIPNNGKDDDENGYVDDYYGYDFAYNDSAPIDGYGHGTHCAGTIAAVGNNLRGIIGVAPKAKVMAVKGLDDGGSGTETNLSKALKYAADNGADVVSNSWGGQGSSSLIEDAVNYAYAKGCVVVAAAGNSNAEVKDFFPANNPNVITVAASDQNDAKCYFSNYGIKIDVAAPGGNGSSNPYNILSLLAANSYFSKNYSSYIVGSEYIRLAGTSMACPHVSGLSALIIAQKPTLSPEEIRQILRTTTDDAGDSGWDLYFGSGRINAYRALQKNSVCIAKISSPLPYAIVDGVINLSGTADGSNFKSYKVEYGQGNKPQTWIELTTGYTPVKNNILVSSWDTTLVNDADFTIKLTVTDTAGSSYEDRILVTIRNTYITVPKSQDFFSAQGTIIEIRGTANATNFINYEIEYFLTDDYGKPIGATTAAGITLISGGNSPVINSLLATLDTSVITTAGIYTLRLSKFTAGFTTTHEVVIYLDPLLKKGWPQKIPPYYDPYKLMFSSVTVADINNDGRSEILIGYGKQVYVFTHDGQSLSGWPQNIDERIQTSPVTADLDGDGFMEIVSGWGKYVWNQDGTLVPGWPNGNLSGKTIIEDINGDGKLDIVIAKDSAVYVVDVNGNNLAGWPVSLGTNWFFASDLATGDINQDGKKEIVIMAYGPTPNYPRIFVFAANGTYKAIGPQFSYGQYYIALGDLDYDADPEIVVRKKYSSDDTTVNVFHHDGANMAGWPVTFSDPLGNPLADVNSPTLGDIDSDGRPEIILGTEDKMKNSLLYVWRYDGSLVNGWPRRRGERRPVWINAYASFYGFGSAAIGDINADGKKEIIVSDNSPYLNIMRSDGTDVSALVLRASGLGANSENPPALADIDGDGKMEVVWVDDNFNLFVWDLPGDYDPKKIEWGQFAHDARHTGRYVADPVAPSVPTNLTATAISSAQINLSWYASTDNVGVLGYHIYRDGTHIAILTTTSYSDTGLSPSTTYTYRVAAYDAAGNISAQSASASATTTKTSADTTPPTGTIKINNNAAYTSSTAVVLNLSATDTESGMGTGSQMQFSNNGTTYSTPEAYVTTKNWTLTSGSGTKKAYVKFKDVAGNWSGVYSDTIILDTTPPATPVVKDDGAYTSSRTTLHASWSSSDSESGIAEYQYAIGTSKGATNVVPWTSVGVNTSVTKTGLSLKKGLTYYFSVKARNGAGLWSRVGYTDGVMVFYGVGKYKTLS